MIRKNLLHSRRYRRSRLGVGVFIFALALLTSSAVWAQGRGSFVNFESPQGHPIETFSLDGHDYLAVCNTRNNSIEIWDTDETASQRRLVTMRVGLEPVSVRFNPRLSRLYTVNFIGDSVSVIHLAGPTGPSSLSATMIETTWVGDEPVDFAFYELDEGGSSRETVLITYMSTDGFSWLDTLTLQPLRPGFGNMAAQVSVDVDTDGVGGVDDVVDRALKEPRSIRIAGDDVLILALKGGENNPVDHFIPDMDLFCDDLTNFGSQPSFLGDLGTTGFDMVFGGDGVLYVVGAEARNKELRDEDVVASAATGFLKSMFYRVENPCGPNPVISRRDVNLEPFLQEVPDGLAGLSGGGGNFDAADSRPVKRKDALSMLTDVVVFETGGTPKVFFTANGNDRVGVIEPDAAIQDPLFWRIRRINVPPSNGNPLSGPNGLALKRPSATMNNDPGHRLYVLNHFDNSITTLDPVAETVVAGGELSLAHDPRPPHLIAGQRLLHDAKLSGNHFVSCASCHIEGRTDGLPWDLGTPDEMPVTIPNHLIDGLPSLTSWDADKEFMITQSLQGLLNFEVSQADQEWVTNAPYHWRGDRADFKAFAGAFQSLLGGRGVSESDMSLFEDYINTVVYPPNPKQPRDRIPSGDFADPADPLSGGRAYKGLKIFHSVATVGHLSCVNCHALPDGSNNRITEGQIETAALRGLFQKEAKRDIDGYSDTVASPYTGFEGMFHTGFDGPFSNQHANRVASINGFNRRFFTGPLCNSTGFATCPDLEDLNQFNHEIDWGVGPLVGCPLTLDVNNVAAAYRVNASPDCSLACGDVEATVNCMEQEAGKANSGVAVAGWDGGQEVGYWYDPIEDLYVAEPSGTTLDRTGLLNLIGSGDLLLFQSTPLGSERRVASVSGIPAQQDEGPAPSSLSLLPMVPNSFYERVPELILGMGSDLDNAGGVFAPRIFIHTLRLYQWGLIKDAASENGFGVGAQLHHDAPRRFQVVGKNIRHGATLALSYHDDDTPNIGPPDPAGPLNQFDLGMITLPLYPTNLIDSASGLPIWQTGVELEPLEYYSMMLGGQFAPGVETAYFDNDPFTFPMIDPSTDEPVAGQFDPLAWNWVWVSVVNSDLSTGDGGWQRVRVQ